MAQGAYRIFNTNNGTYSQLQRNLEDTKDGVINDMPLESGRLVTEGQVSRFVVLVNQPEIVSPENGTEDFMGTIVLSPFVTGESYAGKQTALRYQLALDEEFEKLVGDNTLVTTKNSFKPVYGHNDELNTLNNHEETETDGVTIIEDFDRSQAKIYVRAKYISDVNSSLWSEPIYYITPDAYPVQPELTLEWDSDSNVPQIVTVDAKFYGLSSDGDTPSIGLTSTDWILKKEDGTVVFESLNDTTNKTSFTFKNKFEPNTTYTLEVKFHTEAGDTDVSTYTFTTTHAFIDLPDGVSFDDMVGDLRVGYLGKGEHGGNSTGEDGNYKYIGEWTNEHTLRSGRKADKTNDNTLYQYDVISYNKKLYKSKENQIQDKDNNTFEALNTTPYTTKLKIPNYGTVFNLIAAVDLYNRNCFSVDSIKYLSDFDFGGISGKFTKLEPEYGYNYDSDKSHEVTGYFVPTKKGDDTQAWNKGNEWYTFVSNGKVKYVSTVHFKYVSPFELGLCHLTGKGRTIRIGYHLWRVSIMTIEDAYEFNKIFDGELANENPGYSDLDENHITYEIVRNNEDTLAKYDYVRFGKKLDVKQFDPLSARLFENDDTGRKYYPSYRLVLEHIPESEEPWKREYLDKVNNGPRAVLPVTNGISNSYNVTGLESGETFIYDKFTDTGYFGIVSGSDLFTTNEINAGLNMDGEKVDFEQEWHKFYYHGKIIYIPMFMLRFNVTWNSVMQSGWYGSTPYSHVINKPVLNKNGKYFIGGLQLASGNILTGSSSSSANHYTANNRSLFNETLLRVITGYHGGWVFNPNGEYFGSNLGFSPEWETQGDKCCLIGQIKGSFCSGSMQVGPNFINSKTIYTQERLSKLPNLMDAPLDNNSKFGLYMVLGAGILPSSSTYSPELYGTSTSNTVLSVRSWANNNKPRISTSTYNMFNYTLINGSYPSGTNTGHNMRPIGASEFNNHIMLIDLDDGAQTDGRFAFSPFLEQISEHQKNEIDDFNKKVVTNVAKMEAHNTKLEEHRALQAELERIEAEYLAKIEREGIDERFEGNIRTPVIIEPNAFTRPTVGDAVSVDTLTASNYIVGKSFRGEHTGSDVEWALDEGFNNIIATMSVTGNATRFRINRKLVDASNFEKTCYARVRYKSNNVVSEWSNHVSGQIPSIPPLPDTEYPFDKDNLEPVKEVDSDAYYICGFAYYGHVGPEQTSPYGVNRGTIDPENAPYPLMLQVGDRLVYEGKPYRVVWDDGTTNLKTDISASTNGYKIYTKKDQLVADITMPYGELQINQVDEDQVYDLKLGTTVAWWSWYIANINVIINPTTSEASSEILTNRYMVNTKMQPTKENEDTHTYQYLTYLNTPYGMPIPQVYKKIFPWFFPNGFKTPPATNDMKTNLYDQTNSLSAFVNNNLFAYMDNDGKPKVIYAPDIAISDNVNFWYVAANYKAYVRQQTVRIGKYLFYVRLPYVDEIKCMADAGALSSFSGSVLTLDGPEDNYANSGNIPDKEITASIIKNGKFNGTETKTRSDGLLYMPILEFILQEDEVEVFNSKLGECDYDKELNIGLYSYEEKKERPDHYSARVEGFITKNPLQLVYMHYHGMNIFYNNADENWINPLPDDNNPNTNWLIYPLREGVMNGYAIPSYTIEGLTNISSMVRIVFPKGPLSVEHKNIDWKVTIGRWTTWPWVNYTGMLGTLNTTTYSGNESGYYNSGRAVINCAYGILSYHDVESVVIHYNYSIKGVSNWPYYPVKGRREIIKGNQSSYHQSGTKYNAIGNYKHTFPFLYRYFDSRSFVPFSDYFADCKFHALYIIYREMK